MVHAFSHGGRYFLFDTESGTLIEADKIAYDIVLSDCRQTNFLLSAYTEIEIGAARTELEKLKESGLLFTPEKRENFAKNSGVLKALCLHICHDCNLSCAYCFASQGDYGGPRGMMGFETAKKSVDFLIGKSGKRKNLEIDFFGGEPLMNFGVVKETVDYAKKRGAEEGKSFKFTMTTNCILLDKHTIEYLDREMDNVVLSIDGRKEVHDKVRPSVNGKGSFDIALKNALNFVKIRKKSGKDYYVRGTFTALNKDFSEDVKYLTELGFDRLSIEPVVLPAAHPLALYESDAEVLTAEYDKLVEHFDNSRKNGKGYTFFHFMIDLNHGPCIYKRLKACGAGCEYGAVTPEGEIYPCHQFAGNKDFLLGNINDCKLDTAIQDKFTLMVYDKNDCGDCFAKYHCSGGCFANSYHSAGDFRSHERLGCILMKKRLECALFLCANNDNSFD